MIGGDTLSIHVYLSNALDLHNYWTTPRVTQQARYRSRISINQSIM